MKNPPTIYLTHSREAFALYYGQRALARLQALGQVIRNDSDDELEPDALAHAARDCDIIVAFRIPAIPAHVLDRLPRLAAVCRVAVDVRNIDIETASRNGILVTRASPGFGASVAEWTIGAMISLGRGMHRYDASYHRGIVPTPSMGGELRGASLGVMGYGTIGQHLCRLALAFGMRVRVYDPYVAIDDAGIEQTTLDQALAQSDYVVCLAPANAQTEGMMGRAAFAAMRRGAYFINASRGELVDEAALLDALDSGAIAGCALDVGRARDQMPSPALAAHPRVIATPHIGGLTPNATEHQAMDSADQVADILAGRMPAGALNAAQARRLGTLRERLAHAS